MTTIEQARRIRERRLMSLLADAKRYDSGKVNGWKKQLEDAKEANPHFAHCKWMPIRCYDTGLFDHAWPKHLVEAQAELLLKHGWTAPVICGLGGEVLGNVRAVRAQAELVKRNKVPLFAPIPMVELDVNIGPESWLKAMTLSGHLPELKIRFMVDELCDRGYSLIEQSKQTGIPRYILEQYRNFDRTIAC